MVRTTIAVIVVFLLGGVANAQDGPSKLEGTLYRMSQASVIGGWAFDEWTTAKNIDDPVHVSYKQCWDGSLDCPFPLPNEKTVTFKEVGFPSIFGVQDSAQIALVNGAFDAGILVASHFLYKKGGIWRKVAIGVNFFQGGTHFNAALTNISRRNSVKLRLVPAGAFNVSW